jgi:hypothetical protein
MKYFIDQFITRTSLPPFFNLSSINNDKYSGLRGFKLIKYSKSELIRSSNVYIQRKNQLLNYHSHMKVQVKPYHH